jgi:hypothetical protein
MQVSVGRGMAAMKVVMFTGRRQCTTIIFYILKPNIILVSPISYTTFTAWTTGDILQNKIFNMDYTFQAFCIFYIT